MARLIDILFELVSLIVVVRMVLAAFRGLSGSARARFSSAGSSARPETEKQTIHGETVRDPVCGMFVSTELSHQLKSHGTLLHFCSEECLEQYRKSAAARSA
jgi:YHS domain-containing protein